MKFFRKLWAMLWLSWFYLKQLPGIVYGAWKIGKLPQPVVSIFGGHNLTNEYKYVQWTQDLAKRLVAHEISILTGGGPGIMEAASCSAVHGNKHIHTMGIGVSGLDEEHVNPCVKNLIMTNYFPLRKFLLIEYSVAYVIFPGAFGTLNEVTEVMTLMHTGKIPVRPIILIGKEFWRPLEAWIGQAMHESLMHDEHPEYITFTDDIDHAVAILVAHCKKARKER